MRATVATFSNLVGLASTEEGPCCGPERHFQLQQFQHRQFRCLAATIHAKLAVTVRRGRVRPLVAGGRYGTRQVREQLPRRGASVTENTIHSYRNSRETCEQSRLWKKGSPQSPSSHSLDHSSRASAGLSRDWRTSSSFWNPIHTLYTHICTEH